MKLTVLILSVIISFNLQGQNDHLEPVRNIEPLGPHYDSLSKRLLAGLSDKPLARYLVPITVWEYALSLEKGTNEEYILKYAQCDRSFWSAKTKSQVKISTAWVVVDREFAFLIRELFEVAISKRKNPDNLRQVADGILYRFSIYEEGVGLVSGETISPDKKTKVRDLVSLCEKLKTFVVTNGQGRDTLMAAARDLISRFNS